jgi:hypothetical protein
VSNCVDGGMRADHCGLEATAAPDEAAAEAATAVTPDMLMLRPRLPALA